MDNSQEVLEKINSATTILLACHADTDPDSITSNLLLKRFLTSLGKQAEIVLPDEIQGSYKIFDPNNEIQENVDWKNFDFTKYDLFLTCDFYEYSRIEIDDPSIFGDLTIVSIDHHFSELQGALCISDSTFSSTAEMVFLLLEEWGYKIDKEDAELALTGIVSDTGSFDYGISERVFKTTARLLELGADYNKVKFLLERHNSENELKLWSKILTNLHVDHENKFAYTFLPFEEFEKFGEVTHPTRTTADMFLRTITDTNFGIVMIEKEKGDLQLSIRSRKNEFGVVELCKRLGGGGHFTGGGAAVKGQPFEEAVQKVLDEAIKFAKENL